MVVFNYHDNDQEENKLNSAINAKNCAHTLAHD